MEDAYYLDVVEDIDAGGHEVSEWEADFIESMLKHRPRQMSERQQDIVRRMARKYLGEDLD
jgi:hypothetical protein